MRLNHAGLSPDDTPVGADFNTKWKHGAALEQHSHCACHLDELLSPHVEACDCVVLSLQACQ